MAGNEEIFKKAMNEGHSAAWDQMWERAAASYKTALMEFPNNPKALNSLGLALLQLQQYEDALETYKHVTTQSPDDPIPYEQIAQLNERLGNLKEAVKAAMSAADLYLKLRDVDKAIENWARVTQLNPDHVLAHSRLAMVHEKLGHPKQAVTEYLAVASLLQRAGNVEKVQDAVNRARKLAPDNPEVKQAITLLQAGQLLPKPVRPRGGTGPLAMAQVRLLNAASKQPAESNLDPVAEARHKALTVLAEALFEYSDQNVETQAERKGMQAIMKGTGALSLQQGEQTRIVLHLSQAIDAQTKEQYNQAADELERALEAGYSHPALYFDLGLLRTQTDRTESALRHLQHAVKHKDFALGTRLLMAQTHRKQGRLKEAALDYLEALKLADSQVVPPDQADEIRQLYEPLLEAQNRQEDEKVLARLCDNIDSLLMRPKWRSHLTKSREQLPKDADGRSSLPLAEIIIQSQSSQVLEAISNIHNLARAGSLRTAMEEAFQALTYAPAYLPLHSLIGDLLVREGHLQDAITKFSTIAHAYSVRGEAAQATTVLRKIIKLAPMDMSARTRLIEQLTARGQIDEAIAEYLELADIYYRLAELDMARKTYTTALRLAQQTNNRAWNTQIMHRMADIDMQRLDWRQALRVYEQIRTIRPEDVVVRKNIVTLNLRLAQDAIAKAEIENYMTYLESQGLNEAGVSFLEELAKEYEDSLVVHRALGEQYRRVGRTQEALGLLDQVGDALFESGDKNGLIEVVNLILSMNPPNAEDYRQLLSQI